MQKQFMTIKEVRKLQKDIFLMVLSGDCKDIDRPGRFVNIKIEGLYLRRPISICDFNNDEITIIFKTVGEGTKQLSEMKPGEVLDVLIPLGNGFDISANCKKPVVIGGGIGVPPLLNLCKQLLAAGRKPAVILGFNTSEDAVLIDEFKALGVEPVITTADGSMGTKGFVTGPLADMDFDYVFTCGPEPMLKAIWDMAEDGQFSFEARMACGFGACMGCTCETKYGYKRICKDGPIMYKEEIIW